MRRKLLLLVAWLRGPPVARASRRGAHIPGAALDGLRRDFFNVEMPEGTVMEWQDRMPTTPIWYTRET